MKNLNAHKFLIFCIKKNHNRINIIKKIFVDKKYVKFHSIFLHGNGWLNTFFSSIYKQSQAPKFCFFKHIRQPLKKKLPSNKKCV